MTCDLHIHSHFSSDSEESLEKILQAACKQQIDVIGISDHIDYDYQDPSISFLPDLLSYEKEVTALKERADGVEVLFGIEAGLQPHIAKDLQQMVDHHAFDYVIGSMHTVGRKDLYLGDYFVGRSPLEAWQLYFEEATASVKAFDQFQFFGHLDILKRYNQAVRQVAYEDYREAARAFLRLLIEKGIGLEINTSGLRGHYGVFETLPSAKVLKDYRELGGEIITIGSDAHQAKDVGSGQSEAKALLRELGFLDLFIARGGELLSLPRK